MKIYVAISAVSVAGLIGVGCQTYSPSQTVTLAPEPTATPVFASTTQPVREWDRSTAYIQNGDTDAESPGVRWRTRDDLPPYVYPVAEPAVFIGNLVVMPYTLISERGQVVSTGAQWPATHTAMPPLPPSPEVAPQPGLTEPVPTGTVITEPTVTPGTVADVVPTTQAPTETLTATTQPTMPSFTIAGQVLRPGQFDAAGNAKLSQVVAAAGPSSEDPAKVKITITRPGEDPATTTLSDLLAGKMEDVTVQAGDAIAVEIAP